MSMARSLVLFGAGASVGSDDPNRVPPLGASLFDALCSFKPGDWGSVGDGFADQFKADFEQGMEAFADANPTKVDVLQRAMAAFFFQFQPESTNLYVRLAQRIRDCNWNGTLASLNYERLLKLSLRQAGLHVQCWPPELYTDLELLLPHGCCNLFGIIRAPQSEPAGAGGNIVAQRPTILEPPKRADGTEIPIDLVRQNGGPTAFGEGVMLDGKEIREIDDPVQYANELKSSTVPPVMSYFQPDKPTRAGVSFIGYQRKRFKKLVENASTVAIIGVKVRPNDRHIWDPLRETSAKIVYCAGQDAGNEFRSWSTEAKRRHDEVFPCCWAKAFDDLCSRVGIA